MVAQVNVDVIAAVNANAEVLGRLCHLAALAAREADTVWANK